DELGVTELSKKLKLHKNNVFRILATLQSRNYIEQNKSNDNYKLGIKCLELGQIFIRQRGLLKQAKGILQELAEATGETSYISCLRGNEIVYLDAVEGTSTVRVVLRVGLHMPFYATASGKAMVAFESDEEIADRLAGEPRKFTKNTKNTPEALLQDLKEVREKGYATDLEEMEEGLRCVAAPIRDYTRKVIGAISLSGPANRVSDERIVEVLGSTILRATSTLSSKLGYRE
ncbi:MAG: IclR family transcriptional regulator, partial [Deltaproteobacteria bacterium]|nr:IclR family transcriptional regulator [Deltaproteobacteria bacterium]